jgi:acyl-homoserine-lactone acylase
MVIAGAAIAACSPGDGPESVPLPTSGDTTTTSTTQPPPPEPTTSTTLVPPRYEATIRRTTDGVAHITGATIDDAAYGQGFAQGEDHACTLMDQVLKVYGQRAAALGPGPDGANIESDFAWRAIGLDVLAPTDFAEASDRLVAAFTAFTEGWNDHLAEVGVDALTGWCAGAEWVRPLEPAEVYTYARSIALFASSSQLTDFIAAAQPPGDTAASGLRAPPSSRAATGWSAGAPDLTTLDLGSNGWAIGRDRKEGATGSILLANPHFPWEGELRFVETHLIVPGQVDMYGAQLIGVPGIGIGFTEDMAWTHTVSAGHRFTAYQLTLDPASPTSYLVDGVSTAMTASTFDVDVLRADGTVDTESRTLWRSEHGPIIDFPGLGWTDSTTLTYRDANIDNEEFVEQYLATLTATTLTDLIDVYREHQGVPLFNTVAAGSDGAVWYADTSATPNLSTASEEAFKARLFTDPITKIAYDNGVILLDGSTSANDWEVVPDARDPGLMPWAELPQVVRADYVFNANDSYWVPSAEFTLPPASIANGPRDRPLTLRTRQNAAVLSLNGDMGLSGPDGRFTLDEVRHATFDNTARTAVLLLETLVRACRTTTTVDLPAVVDDDGAVALPAGTIDVTAGCDVLDAWDGRFDLDSVGPMLWRETMAQFSEAERTSKGVLFVDDLDVANPTATPRVPNPDSSPLLSSFARAVQIVQEAGFAIDSPLGSAQFTDRSGTRIPLHGGTDVDGITNIVTWSGLSSSSEPAPERAEGLTPISSLTSEGYPVNFGTSFVMTVELTADAPRAWALLTYGETGDRASPLFDQQMIRFSEKDWREVAYTEEQIAADTELTERVVTGG